MLPLIKILATKLSGYSIYIIIGISTAVTLYLGYRLLDATDTIREIEAENNALRVSVENAKSTIANMEKQQQSKINTITEINQLLSKCYDDKRRIADHIVIVDSNMTAISDVPEQNKEIATRGENNVTEYQNTAGINYVNNLMDDLNRMQ